MTTCDVFTVILLLNVVSDSLILTSSAMPLTELEIHLWARQRIFSCSSFLAFDSSFPLHIDRVLFLKVLILRQSFLQDDHQKRNPRNIYRNQVSVASQELMWKSYYTYLSIAYARICFGRTNFGCCSYILLMPSLFSANR